MLGGLPFAPKPRPCAHCGSSFAPVRPMQKVCSPMCAARKVKADKAEERAKVKTRKEAIKTIPVLIAEAQTAFNAFIRERDRAQPCISCGAPLALEAIGGGYDCGHYRSRGSAPQLRYDERNAHGQCKRCNRYGSGMVVEYRAGLVARIGQAALHELEADSSIRKWTREGLTEIRATYRAKAKAMKVAA